MRCFSINPPWDSIEYFVFPSFTSIELNELQCLNANNPIDITVDGITNDFIPVDSNEYSPIVCNPFTNVTLVNFLHPLNALLLIV